MILSKNLFLLMGQTHKIIKKRGFYTKVSFFSEKNGNTHYIIEGFMFIMSNNISIIKER